MKWQNYELEDTISKSTHDIRLWQTEKGILEINKDPLGIAVRLEGWRRGYVFYGNGKLLLDTIVETEEGSMGKPTDRELNDVSLMLGDIEEPQKHLWMASEEDFVGVGYENQQGFVGEAEDLCNRFFRGRGYSHQCLEGNQGLTFAFQNGEDKLDMLITKGSKLVYKATDIIFVADQNRVVLRRANGVVCQSNGKSVINLKD